MWTVQGAGRGGKDTCMRRVGNTLRTDIGEVAPKRTWWLLTPDEGNPFDCFGGIAPKFTFNGV